jgi:hypothetical protein
MDLARTLPKKGAGVCASWVAGRCWKGRHGLASAAEERVASPVGWRRGPSRAREQKSGLGPQVERSTTGPGLAPVMELIGGYSLPVCWWNICWQLPPWMTTILRAWDAAATQELAPVCCVGRRSAWRGARLRDKSFLISSYRGSRGSRSIADGDTPTAVSGRQAGCLGKGAALSSIPLGRWAWGNGLTVACPRGSCVVPTEGRAAVSSIFRSS